MIWWMRASLSPSQKRLTEELRLPSPWRRRPAALLRPRDRRPHRSARTGHTVGMAEVVAVRDMVRVFTEMDAPAARSPAHTSQVARNSCAVGCVARGQSFHLLQHELDRGGLLVRG